LTEEDAHDVQDLAQKKPQPSNDVLEVMSDGGEDGVGGIASAALEIATAEMALGLQVTNRRLNAGSTL
jgi:hypothetical protein